MGYTQKKFLKSKIGQEITIITLEDAEDASWDIIVGVLMGFDKNTILVANSNDSGKENLIYIRNIVRIK